MNPTDTDTAQAQRFDWSEKFDLEYPEIDAIHHEFVELVDALLGAEDAEVPARLEALIEHTRAHFETESTWMQISEFPPIHCHESEHANVMEVALKVRERVAEGEFELGRTLAAGLAEWFEVHADSMDRVLAMWMKHHAAGTLPQQPADGSCCG